MMFQSNSKPLTSLNVVRVAYSLITTMNMFADTSPVASKTIGCICEP
jgi:hypothetical protein